MQVEGPDLRLQPKAAETLGLAVHELATNALKYGALSASEGAVEVKWDVEPDGEAQLLRLVWREKGGPPVTAPSKRGFGTRLIERSLASEFGGDVGIDFAASGVVCTVRAPLPDGNA